MKAARAIGALAFCAAAAWAIAWGSGAPISVEPGGDAAIRFSWRASGRPIEECRTPSAEEQARLPVHMRRTQICERRLAAFRLRVELDGERAIDERVAPEGAQHDRPAYVLHELRVAPGVHRIAVRFEPEAGAAAPQALAAELELAARQVALVTENAQSGQLEVRRGPAP